MNCPLCQSGEFTMVPLKGFDELVSELNTDQ